MVRRLGLGKNNHLTYASLALNPRYVVGTYQQHLDVVLIMSINNMSVHEEKYQYLFVENKKSKQNKNALSRV